MMKYSFKFASYILLLSFTTILPSSNKEHLITQLFDIGVFQFGNFTLKSGKTSSFYIDMRVIISHPQVLMQVVECLHEIISTCDYDCICGVPYSGLIIATGLSLQHQKPMILKRKETKTYGTQKMIEGTYKRGNRCLVIEDVITTGQSILETTTVLENEGLRIHDVIVLIDREESGVANVANKGHHVQALFKISEIAHYLYANKRISQQQFEYMLPKSYEQKIICHHAP